MRLEKQLTALIFALCLVSAPALAGGDVHLLFGQKRSNEPRFDDVDIEDQPLAGVMLNVDFDKPLSLAVDLLLTTDDDTRGAEPAGTMIYFTEVDTFEIHLGPRKVFRREKLVRPYIGGGAAWVRMKLQQSVSGDLGIPGSEYTDTIIDDTDSTFGYWIDAGIRIQWRSGLCLGADARYSAAFGDAQLTPVGEPDSIGIATGGVYYALTVGYAW